MCAFLPPYFSILQIAISKYLFHNILWAMILKYPSHNILLHNFQVRFLTSIIVDCDCQEILFVFLFVVSVVVYYLGLWWIFIRVISTTLVTCRYFLTPHFVCFLCKLFFFLHPLFFNVISFCLCFSCWLFWLRWLFLIKCHVVHLVKRDKQRKGTYVK